jgi:hypothetical protein
VTNFDRGAEFLRVIPQGRRLAYFADEVRQWYWVTRPEVARLGKMLVASPHDAYSEWCGVAGKPVSLRAAQKIYRDKINVDFSRSHV